MEYKIQPLEKVIEVNNNNRHNNSFKDSKNNNNAGFNDMLELEKGKLKKIDVLRELKNQLTNIQEIYTNETQKKLK